METYIINPWVVYLIDTIPKLQFLFSVSVVITVLGLLISLDTRSFIPYRTKLTVILSISVISLMLIPNQATVYKMMAANVLTVENVKSIGETLEEFSIKMINELKGFK